MHPKNIIALITILTLIESCKPVLYYRLKNIQGTVYDSKGDSAIVKFKSRNLLLIDSCKNKQIDTFLRTLTLGKHGRIELEHLLTTSANITINISEKVGIMFQDGKYRVIAGMTWLDKNKPNDLILNEPSITFWTNIFNKYKYVYVYENNRIELFKGSIIYANDSSFVLNDSNVSIFHWENGNEFSNFSMDTIELEPFMFPDLVYKNIKELYYFGGLHEIFHTRPENIKLQENVGDQEYGAIELEKKAIKKRKTINKRKVRY